MEHHHKREGSDDNKQDTGKDDRTRACMPHDVDDALIREVEVGERGSKGFSASLQQRRSGRNG